GSETRGVCTPTLESSAAMDLLELVLDAVEVFAVDGQLVVVLEQLDRERERLLGRLAFGVDVAGHVVEVPAVAQARDYAALVVDAAELADLAIVLVGAGDDLDVDVAGLDRDLECAVAVGGHLRGLAANGDVHLSVGERLAQEVAQLEAEPRALALERVLVGRA